MSFQPVITGGGIAGWQFLQRTYDAQFQAFSQAPVLERDTDYFAEKIGSIQSAEDLVSDRRLLSVALGAFGLTDDLDNRYFIRKILEDGTGSNDSLANKLTDNRYRQLSDAFGFGPGETVKTGDIAGMAEIAQQHKVQSFEVSVGEQDDTMRIALYAQRELESLASGSGSEETKWFSVMGLPPLRSMFETALGLPTSFGQIDIDQQLETFRDKTNRALGDGSVAQFSTPEARKRLTDMYLARSQISAAGSALSSGSTALALLQASQG